MMSAATTVLPMMRPAHAAPSHSARRAVAGRSTAAAAGAPTPARRGATAVVCASRASGTSQPSSSTNSAPSVAAPSGFEHQLGRMEAAGVDVHNTGVEYLMEGATGAHVRELQRFLTKTGQYRYKDGVTGFYGPVTTNAVKKWQHQHGLPASGGWGYQSREMYLRVKSLERRKLLASPEAPSRPDFGFEASTSGLKPPLDQTRTANGSPGTSTAVGYTPGPSMSTARSAAGASGGFTAVGIITTAFWVGMGTAVLVVVGRVVTWQLAVREAAQQERQEMERDRQQVYERWDAAVKESDGGERVVEMEVEVLSADERLRAAKSEAAALLGLETVEARLHDAKSEAETLLKANSVLRADSALKATAAKAPKEEGTEE
mmetsp:Transcript_5184/g.8102  ORF Transcript_5184/g.8102 Transcript_5184/m.8102 type:complete len:375 (+) Transcript_5184:257-1381(+)